ncbi:MAG: DIP1984 family protein [Clostridia bacterium]|nr:DIP1984 family protein [Clostridia bacterium]
MKLAEALQERADLARRIDSVKSRLCHNAIVQEGEQPAEAPASLLAEFDACTNRMEELLTRINLTNCQTVVLGQSLTALLARRDALKIKLDGYRMLVNEASSTARRATRSEIKILSTVNVTDLQKHVDRIAKELRQLDNAIQQANWTTDLL